MPLLTTDATEFTGSSEADKHIYATLNMMRAQRLINWARATDRNLTVSESAEESLDTAIEAFIRFIDILENAE